MKRPNATRRIYSSLRRNWAASLLIALFLLPAVACTGREETAASASQQDRQVSVSRLSSGWMGRYAKKDPALAKMLTEQEGWLRFRDMDLFEAIRFFSMEHDTPGRLGAARSCLEMARTCDVLDSFFLDIEHKYITSLGAEVKPGQLGRLGFIKLRRQDVKGAREIFFGQPPKGKEVVWELGRIGVQITEGQEVGAKLQSLCSSVDKANKALVRVATFLWGKPCNPGDTGYYGQALGAMESGDLFSGLVALQMIDKLGTGNEAEPDIFLNTLFRHVFARMALESLKDIQGPEAAYYRGMALMLMSDFKAAAENFSKSGGLGKPADSDAARIFGAEFDGEEASDVARVTMGYALIRAGEKEAGEKVWKEALAAGLSPFAIGRLAAYETEVGSFAALADIQKGAQSAVESISAIRQKLDSVEGKDVIVALLDARDTRSGLDAARVARSLGQYDKALDRLDLVQQKKQGNRANFVNPPSFLVELSRAYADTGQYAPATEIMFSMSNDFTSSRIVYESLKRLYASKTGGEAPPR